MSAEANPPPPKPPLSDRWSRVSPWTPCSRSSTLPPEGRATFDRVVETVEAMGDDASNYTDAIRRYALADATAAIVREAWEAEGRPVVRPATGSTPARPHPLLVALRESETHAQTLGAALCSIPPLAPRRDAPDGARDRLALPRTNSATTTAGRSSASYTAIPTRRSRGSASGRRSAQRRKSSRWGLRSRTARSWASAAHDRATAYEVPNLRRSDRAGRNQRRRGGRDRFHARARRAA